ncbi:phytochromobilin:ferredoxin oxidoreductase, chloroplastic isoform X2 [Silene latifolia]|uniref:phytochromobilin:ferredoxin oxidoreductase, chloroplastic isoform X2 n=1 Tax=Silene latifolia TaxID=37657 RepID=UPI003D77EC64
MDILNLRVMVQPCLPYSKFSCSKYGVNKKMNNNNVRKQVVLVVSNLCYQRFVDFGLDQATCRTRLVPLPLQERFSSIQAIDDKAKLNFLSFEGSKIRLMRSMYIDGGDSLQVLDFAVFPKVECDLPIFCANFFSNPAMSIIVLDLNPLHNVITDQNYKDKYYRNLMPLGAKYAELLPWGGKLTSESLKFFSPIVIWTRFTPSQQKNDILFEAFKDYFKAWLDLMEEAIEESDAARTMRNMEAQHKYLTWRTEKDPGHQMLKNLIGEAGAKDVLKSFLFNGVDELGSKNFLDYFPEYKLEDGTVNGKRSVMGKSYEERPWDNRGEFIANKFQ